MKPPSLKTLEYALTVIAIVLTIAWSAAMVAILFGWIP